MEPKHKKTAPGKSGGGFFKLQTQPRGCAYSSNEPLVSGGSKLNTTLTRYNNRIRNLVRKSNIDGFTTQDYLETKGVWCVGSEGDRTGSTARGDGDVIP
jgi:hypothetical protein